MGAPGFRIQKFAENVGNARILAIGPTGNVCDGGVAMLMAEVTTAVQHNLAIKIVILRNNSLSEVRFEQQDLGNPTYGCDLGPIDFVAFAKACGADGFCCSTAAEVRPAITAALRTSKAAIVEAIVDPEEPPAKPEDVQANRRGVPR